jgi:AcrR family transcriptional regulator
MPTIPRRVRQASGRPETPTEQARRAQLIAVTIAVIAEHGYARCSLQRIADAAGITKAAVIYHFATKQDVIRAAYAVVIEAMIAYVGEQIEAATTTPGRVEAYLSAMIGYLGAHPQHVRLIVEALDETNATGIDDRANPEARWKPLAILIDAARADGAYPRDLDARTLAVILGGALDAILMESLRDPSFDLAVATRAILGILPANPTRRTAGGGI